MDHILIYLVVILSLVVIFGIVNEKFIKIPKDIALVLFAFILSALIKLISMTGLFSTDKGFIGEITSLPFEKFLLDGVLCFMLFAGASKVNVSRFKKNLGSISLLAFLTTVLSSLLYGGLFYLLNLALNLGFDIWLCIMLGCIVSPTDPIAATSILNKCGLSKNVTSVIEGESLFNDGIGVAIFICFRNIVTNTSDLSLPVLLVKELFGALFIGFVVSFLLFKLLKMTKDPMKHIFISLLTVALSYVICEYLGFSGVIASVVCGMYFSYAMSQISGWRDVVDEKDFYNDFWDVLDNILNSILFVLIGLSILYIPSVDSIIWLCLAAVILNLLCRFVGVLISSLIIKRVPNHYSKLEFTSLLTWTGLKGGLSLALALTTREYLSLDAYNVVLIMTFVTIFFTIICQGLTTAKAYRLIEKNKEKRELKAMGESK